MYTTKYKVHVKADQGQFSLNSGGKKGDFGVKKDKISRYEGKQFSVPRSNMPFSTFSFTVPGKQDPYCAANSYLNAPRKLGFGSSEPPKRDEFSNTIAIERYREGVKAVNDAAAAQAKKLLRTQQQKGGDECVAFEEEEKEEIFEYDQAHSVQPDVVGKPKSWKKMNLGSLRTTTADYGVDCGENLRKSAVARTTASASFFNNNHLSVGTHEH